MKNTSRHCLISLIALLLFISCSESKEENPMGGEFIFSESFITWFYKMDSADLLLLTYDLEESTYEFIWQGYFTDYYTREHNSQEYSRLCNMFGDVGLNAYLETLTQASINDFTGISITSSSDFPGHPAGTELGDIVYISLSSAKPFIDSGYSDSFLSPNPVMIGNYRVIPVSEAYTRIYKLAKEITKEDLMLIGRHFTVEFHDMPVEVNDVVFFTVTLKQSDEDPINGTFGVDFSTLVNDSNQ